MARPVQALLPPPVNVTMGVPPQVGGSDRLRRVGSPPIGRLRAALAGGSDPDAVLAGFWQELAGSGTPLFDDAGPGRTVVTFVARARQGTDAVFLVGNKLADPHALDDCRFERVEGTDVWWLAIELASDWRAGYGLAVVPAGAGPIRGDELHELRRRRATAAASPEAAAAIDRWFDVVALAAPDPLAREHLDDRQSIVSLPDAPPQPWLAMAGDTERGTLHRWTMASAALGNEREIAVHQPAAEPDGPWPVLLLLDGEAWLDLPIAPALDAAVGAAAIPPLLTVLVPAMEFSTRIAELTCNRDWVDFVVDDVLGAVAERWPATADPQRVIIAGQSLGGLSAMYAACARPDRIANVVAQSGSFWWPNAESPDDREWLTGQLATAAPPAGVTYLEVGLQEWVLLEPTRRLRDVLERRGSRLVYREFNGGHDRACWRGSLFDGLAAVTAQW